MHSAESFAHVRDGCLFTPRGSYLACRDAFNGMLRWARPGAGRSWAIGGGRLFLQDAGVPALDLRDGREFFRPVPPGKLPVHEILVADDALVVAAANDPKTEAAAKP